jgi:hypothetical protein
MTPTREAAMSVWTIRRNLNMTAFQGVAAAI